MKKYAIWNNKGGVGKTFLSFVLATEYAKSNPSTNVLIIDTCPQADVSQVLLGGTSNEGVNYLKISNSKKTLAGYIDERINKSPYSLLGSEVDFFHQVSQYNKEIPDNVYLVCGDNALELFAQTLTTFSGTNKVGTRGTYYKEIHRICIDLQDAFSRKYGSESVCFLDTNPSFSIYTKMALYASEQLIIPCFSDLGSLLALKNIMRLVYSVQISGYESNFKEESEKYSLALPLIFKIVLGRSTIYNTVSAKAFQNIENQITQCITDLKQQFNGSVFANTEIVYKLRNFNSVAPIIHDTSKLLTNLNTVETLSNQENVTINHIENYRGEVDGSIKSLLNLL